MLRQALVSNPRGKPVARGASTPAPTGGWNARDNLADMKPDEAVSMDNFFPLTSRIRLRRGYASHATGMSGPVESLMAYAFGSTQKMFAANGTNIYDVSVAGAVGSAVVTSLSNARWQHVNFGTAGGNFLVIANGADSVRNYNGTSWSTPVITGVTSSTLIHVNVFKRRLFFVQKDTLKAWYLPVVSIAGAANEIDLAPITSLGGYLMAMATWTRDGGDGVDDLAIFITSKGEAVIYQGTDPGDASAWALVGVFRIGAPIGRRCFQKIGSDLIIITQDGFVPLSLVLASGRLSQRLALSDKISGAVNIANRDYGANFGWQPIFYPKGSYALFNIPISLNAISHQYVVNTTTGAWCRFTNQNANCWEIFSDDLYFGGSGVVYKADSGTSDMGANIDGDVLTSYNYFGSRGVLKRFTMVRPVLASNGSLTAAIRLNVDFENNFPTSVPSFSGSGGSPWDTSPWDTSPWGTGEIIRKDWQSVEGLGYCAAIRMRLSSNTLDVFWNSVDWLYEPGGFV